MIRDLRLSPKAHLLDGSAGLCSLVWQGDFGSGVQTSSGTFSDPGINPWVLYGPLAATATNAMVNAIPALPFKVGTVVQGDYATEWVFCRWVPGSTLDLLPGQAFAVDEHFTAALLTTTVASTSKNFNVYFSAAFYPATAAGTYYLWLARAGNVAAIAAASSVANGQGESTATAGALKFLVTKTTGAWNVTPATANGASSSITFKADSTNGSPYLLNVTSQVAINGVTATGLITDLMLGSTITGTGLPANSCIGSIDKQGTGGTYRIGIGTSTTGNQKTLQNASSGNTQATYTLTTMVAATVSWPTIANIVTP